MGYRIKVLLGCWFAVASAAAMYAASTAAISAAPVDAKTIADHLSSVKSMSGDFVQSGPNAERTRGRFFLQRPGKIRFNYAGQSGISVIADGKSLVVYN
ncbi:outer membrane lipoprotein carrier protein LolA, partial [Mesorhizobium sp. M7A.F.Ca.US.001.01.1.1]